MRKRPYLRTEWLVRAVTEPIHREIQRDGRVRYWIFIPALEKYLRVVTLADGKTIHNAFPDRGFRRFNA